MSYFFEILFKTVKFCGTFTAIEVDLSRLIPSC